MRIRISGKDRSIQDIKLSLFISSYFLVQCVNLFIKLCFGTFLWWTYFSRAVLGALMLVALVPIWQRKKGFLCFTEFLFASLFLLTALYGTQTEGFADIVFNTLFVFVPMSAASVAIEDLECLQKQFYRNAWINTLLLAFLCLRLRGGDYNYLMSVGYALLLNALFFADNYFAKRRLIDLAAFCGGVLLILAMGSRGPIICIASFFLFKVIFTNKSLGKKLLLYSLIVVVVFSVYTYFGNIVVFLNTVLGGIGFRSRTLELVLSSAITKSSGREELLLYYQDLIRRRPLIGYGLAGGWISDGSYPHNYFVELFLSFGYLGGIIASLATIINILKGVRSPNMIVSRMAIVFTSFIVGLMISGTFVSTPEYYICMAICLKQRGKLYEPRSI